MDGKIRTRCYGNTLRRDAQFAQRDQELIPKNEH